MITRTCGLWLAASVVGMLAGQVFAQAPSTATAPTELVPRASHSFGVDRLAYWGDGAFLISSGGEGTVKVWDVKSARLLRTIRVRSPMPDFAVTPHDKYVVTGGADGDVTLWD